MSVLNGWNGANNSSSPAHWAMIHRLTKKKPEIELLNCGNFAFSKKCTDYLPILTRKENVCRVERKEPVIPVTKPYFPRFTWRCAKEFRHLIPACFHVSTCTTLKVVSVTSWWSLQNNMPRWSLRYSIQSKFKAHTVIRLTDPEFACSCTVFVATMVSMSVSGNGDSSLIFTC